MFIAFIDMDVQAPEEGRRTHQPKHVKITIKMKTIVRKPSMIKIITSDENEILMIIFIA